MPRHHFKNPSPRLLKTALALAVAGLHAPAALAAPGPIGNEFRVNANGWTQNAQYEAAVAVAGPGQSGVAWAHQFSVTDNEIMARFFAADGSAPPSQFIVANSAANEVDPDIAMDEAGNAVVVWTQKTATASDVYLRRYSATTRAFTPAVAVATTGANNRRRAKVAMDADGDFVVGFQEKIGASYAVRAQRYNALAAPVGSTLNVSAVATLPYDIQDVAMNAEGDFVVVYGQVGYFGGSAYLVPRARRFPAAGSAGPEFEPAPFGSDLVADIRDTTGEFVLVLQGEAGLVMQAYSASSAPLGGQSIITTAGSGPSIAIDASGSIVVAWHELGDTDYEVYARRMDFSGAPQGAAFRVNQHTSGYQSQPSVGVDADGDTVIAWDSYGQDGSKDGIYARRYRGDEVLDLATQLTADRSSAYLGDAVGYTAIVTNLRAPDFTTTGNDLVNASIGSALGTRLALTIPSTATVTTPPGFVPATAGTCSARSTGYLCRLDQPLGAGQQARLAFGLSSSTAGLRTSLARVYTQSFDDDHGNDSASASTSFSCNPGTVQFSSLNYAFPESSGLPQVVVQRIGGTCGAISVQVDTSGASAIAGVDFTDITQVVTFADGDSLGKPVNVPFLNDSIDEPDESFTATLSNPVGTTLGSINKARVTLTDDDLAPKVNFTAAGQTVTEDNLLLTLTASLSSVSGRNVSIPLNLSGTAFHTGDYLLGDAVLTIPAGSKTGSVDLIVIEDEASEGTETAIVTMGAPTNATASVIASHTVTITDDDTAPVLPVVTFAAATSSVVENVSTGKKNVSVKLSAAAAGAISVPYSVTGGTADGSDFTLPAGQTVTIPAGATTAQFAVTIINDAVVEGNDTVQLTLGTPSGGATLGTAKVHTLTITNDDAAP